LPVNFGAFVVTPEEDVLGRLDRLLMDSVTNQVHAYIVRLTSGSNREVVVPLAAVVDIEDGLVLDLDLAALEMLPDYRAAAPVTSSHSLTTNPGKRPDRVKNFVLSAETRVECADGEIGSLRGVSIDEMTNEVTDVNVHLNDVGRLVRIPLAWASSIHADRIRFSCARSEI
jgi:hypothetical protein